MKNAAKAGFLLSQSLLEKKLELAIVVDLVR